MENQYPGFPWKENEEDTELYISALYKPHVCTRPLLHFGLNSGIPVIAARAISDLVEFTNTAMFVGMSTMRQTIYMLHCVCH